MTEMLNAQKRFFNGTICLISILADPSVSGSGLAMLLAEADGEPTFGWVATAASAMMLATVVSAAAMRGRVADLFRRLLMISVRNTCGRGSSLSPC